jgi:AraC-like DNA-binding protein
MLRQEPTQSITAIAAACGFATSQYFATIFRREMGLSPRSFRGH